MSGIISGLAGAGGAADRTGGYYQDAMGRLVDAYGSPAADTFGKEQAQSLQPLFDKQNANLAARESAMGITHSGAGKADMSDLAAAQSSTLASAIAPLYQQALGQYGQINAAEPGAQASAYQNAINNFYTGLSDAGSLAAGLPPTAQPQSISYAAPSDGNGSAWQVPDNPSYAPDYSLAGYPYAQTFAPNDPYNDQP